MANARRCSRRQRPSAVALAARAEAFALKSRWKEAEKNYRLAIESVDDEKIKRSWWFNLADIELRLDNESQRQTALRAALPFPADEISRRAADIQRANSGGPSVGGSARAIDDQIQSVVRTNAIEEQKCESDGQTIDSSNETRSRQKMIFTDEVKDEEPWW